MLNQGEMILKMILKKDLKKDLKSSPTVDKD